MTRSNRTIPLLREGDFTEPRGAVWLAVGCMVLYACFFWGSVSAWWFNPEWATDDSLQQAYPFHRVHDPALFKGDFITYMMEQYLTPLHSAVWWAVTSIVHDPVMTGHWVMLLQLALTSVFLFLGVRHAGGIIPACAAVMWFLHTRHVVQRMTQGLPRGWAAPLIAGFFYFLLTGRHRGVLALLFAGCLLHPPVTLLLAIAYGLFLTWRVVLPKTRSTYLAPWFELLLISPVFALSAWLVVRMPPEIGTMASYEVAAQMPEFSVPKGRFPFVPLHPVSWEIRTFGFQAFLSRFYNPGSYVRSILPWVVVGTGLFLAFFGALRRRVIFPAEVVTFLLATGGVYFASRALAFKLYVPDRHLQFPLAFFFIVAFILAFWRAGALFVRSKPAWVGGSAALFILAGLVVLGGGSGLQGSANFNSSRGEKGGVFEWIKTNTPKDALIAGEPKFIDGVQLWGQRAAYITFETAHPFYDRYYAEAKRRFGITLQAHYARTLGDLVTLIEPEGIDYFVFERKRFYPEALQSATYFRPFDELVANLTQRDPLDYAYRELPREVDLERFPFLVFRDARSVVIDVRRLSGWLKEQETRE